MEVVWHLEIFITLLACVPPLISTFLHLKAYLVKKYKVSLLWTLVFLFNACLYLFVALSMIFLDPLFMKVGILFIIPISFCTIGAFDKLSREGADPYKFTVLGFLSAALIISAFDPTAAYPTENQLGVMAIFAGGRFLQLSVLMNFFNQIFAFKYIYQIFRSSKEYEYLKQPSKWLWIYLVCILISFTLAGIPMIGYQIFGAVAMFCLAIAFYRYPKLFFFLPFKALRLIVINNDSGIPLFTYTWKAGKKMADETLFSGMIQGVGLIAKESINRGRLRELRLTDGVLILYSEDKSPITCALVSTRSSTTLHQALNRFHKLFLKHFQSQLDHPEDISQFKEAKSYVEDAFPFILD